VQPLFSEQVVPLSVPVADDVLLSAGGLSSIVREEVVVTAFLFVLLVAVGNFVLGFLLAVNLGHGPAWAELPNPTRVRDHVRAALARRSKGSPSTRAAR
jgi:hypothetical protein